MEERVGKGAVVLIISGVICKMLGAFFRLPLTNIIGIKGIGMFQMVMSLYSLLLVFVSGGVSASLSKLVSSARADGDQSKIYSYKRMSLIYSMTISFLIGLIFALLNDKISALQGATEGNKSYFLLILLLPLGSGIGVFRGIIQGYENMIPTAVSQVLEQSMKFITGLLFAFIFGKTNASNGVFGAFLGITLSEVVAFLYLVFVMRKRYKTPKSNLKVGKDFFYAVIPLSFASAINPFTNAIESLSIVSLLSLAGIESEKATILYGLQTGVVGALMHFPLIISLSVAVALLPKLSYLFEKNDIENQKGLISQSFNYMWFFLIPLTFGLISISNVLYPLVYPNVIEEYLNIILNLTMLSGISIILSAVMQFVISLLQAKGCFTEVMVYSIIAGIFKISTLFILARIPFINIFAILISNIVFNSILCICGLINLGKVVKIGAFEFLLPLLSSCVMVLCVKIILSLMSGVIGLAISILGGSLIYFVLSFPLSIEIFKTFLSKLKLKKKNVC